MVWRRYVTITCLILLFCYGGWRFWNYFTGGFTPNTIHSNLPYSSERDAPFLSQNHQEKILNILNQPYTYFGKGAQCYAFISQDGRYVLKFFKSKHHRLNYLARLLAALPILNSYYTVKIKTKEKNLSAIFKGYLLSYQLLPEDSGIVYMHLNSTDHLKNNVKVLDGFGTPWSISLDSSIFILQDYCETLGQVLSKALKEGDAELAAGRLKQVVDMYMRGYEKNIYDRDHAVLRNTGFADGHPIHLDVGHFTLAENSETDEFFKKDMAVVLDRFEVWLKENFPLHRAELIEEIKEYAEKQFELKLAAAAA